MPKRKYKRPVYTVKNKRLDPQMETGRFRDLISAKSLGELLKIQGKRNEKAY